MMQYHTRTVQKWPPEAHILGNTFWQAFQIDSIDPNVSIFRLKITIPAVLAAKGIKAETQKEDLLKFHPVKFDDQWR